MSEPSHPHDAPAAQPALADGAAAGRLHRAGRPVLAAAAWRRSIEDSLGPDRPAGAANRAAGAGGPRQQWRASARARSRLFKGKVSVVNVWASWCVPCHDEAPLLTELGQGQAAAGRRHQLQGCARQRPALPRPLRQSVRHRRRRRQRPRLDRMGRLRRARDFRGRPRRHHRLQDGRPGDAGKYRHRAEGRDRQGAEGDDVSCPSASPACGGVSGAALTTYPFVTSPPSASLASSDAGSR